MNAHILIIDGDASLCDTIRMASSALPCEVFSAPDEKSARDLLDARSYDVVFCEGRFLAGESGELLGALRRHLPSAMLVLTCDQKLEDLAHDALRCGAFATLLKPASLPEVALLLRRTFECRQGHFARQSLERQLRRNAPQWPVVAASEPMIALLEDLERASDSDAHVLLEGETGTEKQVIARTIHAQSARRTGPFVVVDCSRIATAELERELFGDEQNVSKAPRARRVGALVSAGGGSLFLDEVDALPERLQANLAALLSPAAPVGQPRDRFPDHDFRLIAAASPKGCGSEKEGRFAADLDRQLSALPLRIPALRERPEDIPLLSDHFLQSFGRPLKKPDLSLRDRTLEHLTDYPWPGNVRELENLVERLALVAPNGPIGPSLLPEAVLRTASPSRAAPAGSYLRYARQCAEISAIEHALLSTQGNRTHAARRLGISHRSLLYKIKQYGIRN